MYDQPTWRDFAHQEQHGVLPSAASTADDMGEFYGDLDGGDYDSEHVADVERMLRDEAVQREIAELRRRIEDLERERAELLAELDN